MQTPCRQQQLSPSGHTRPGGPDASGGVLLAPRQQQQVPRWRLQQHALHAGMPAESTDHCPRCLVLCPCTGVNLHAVRDEGREGPLMKCQEASAMRQPWPPPKLLAGCSLSLPPTMPPPPPHMQQQPDRVPDDVNAPALLQSTRQPHIDWLQRAAADQAVQLQTLWQRYPAGGTQQQLLQRSANTAGWSGSKSNGMQGTCQTGAGRAVPYLAALAKQESDRWRRLGGRPASPGRASASRWSASSRGSSPRGCRSAAGSRPCALEVLTAPRPPGAEGTTSFEFPRLLILPSADTQCCGTATELLAQLPWGQAAAGCSPRSML